jgi:hypothetical protein
MSSLEQVCFLCLFQSKLLKAILLISLITAIYVSKKSLENNLVLTYKKASINYLIVFCFSH